MIPLLAFAYLWNLWQLFVYMNTDQNPALRPEFNKMIYQALLMMLSLSVYLIANVVIVCGKYDKKQDWILVYQIAIFLAIFPQLAYIFFCHQRSFQRMQINFEEAEDINDTRSKNTGL